MAQTGRTSLLEAVFDGRDECVKILCAAGADLDIRNNVLRMH